MTTDLPTLDVSPDCSWCGTLLVEPVEHCWRVEAFSIDIDLIATVSRHEQPAATWAACPQCAPLVEAGSHGALGARAVAGARRRGLAPVLGADRWSEVFAAAAHHLTPVAV